MADFGRILIFLGIALVICGTIVLFAVRMLPWLGNLPGDFRWESGNSRVYFPFVSMLLLSVIGSILLNIIIRIFRR